MIPKSSIHGESTGSISSLNNKETDSFQFAHHIVFGNGWMRRFFSSILLLLWLDPSVLQVREEIYISLARITVVAPQERCFTACVEGPSFEMHMKRRKIPFYQYLGAWHDVFMGFCPCRLFEFTPRKNSILNIG